MIGEESMKRLMAAFAAALLFQGCGGVGLYHDTDVVEPKDFELKVATGIQMSGGLMQSGNLEYSGSGDLVQVYRDYLTAMRAHGWTSAADDIAGQKATGTLRKDNRTCALEFTSAAGQVKVTIKITQTK
jgi:hypothetical protein